MEVIKDTPFEFGYLVWQVRPPQPSLTVVVKATYALPAPGEAECAVAAEQALVTGEVFHDDDETKSLRFDSDLAVMKPHGECFLAGTCFPPGGRAAGISAVSFRVGRVARALAVFGDRHWPRGVLRGATPTDPEPFTAMPLSWERAFGGAGVEKNPVGAGLADVDTPAGPRKVLPNLEDPQRLISAPGDRPDPAGLFPIPRTWKARMRKAGTCDDRWLAARWPWFPEDFDWSYFNAAPPAQQISGYWRGDEEVYLQNLHPTRHVVQAKLPGHRARVFIEVRTKSGVDFREVPLHLDTITVDADGLRVFCVWRGLAEVPSERLDEVPRVFVAHEERGEWLDLAASRERMERRLRALEAEDEAFQPEEPAGDPLESRTTFFAPDVLATLDALPPSGEAEVTTTVFSADAVAGALDAAPTVPAPSRKAAPQGDGGDGGDGDDENEGDLAVLQAKLVSAGLAPAPDAAQKERPPPDVNALKAAYRAAGATPPPELDQLTEPDPEPVTVAAPSRPRPRDLRAEVLARWARGDSFAGEDLSRIDLAGVDLAGIDLRGALLQGASLAGADLRKSELDGAVLAGADLAGAKLAGATLKGADLTGAQAPLADFTGALLEDAVLSDGVYAGAVFRGAACARAVLWAGDFTRCAFTEATLDEADFEGATLTDVDCAGASLVEASLLGATAERLNAAGADVTRLRAGGAVLAGAVLRGVKGEGSRWAGARLERADFTGALLADADFSGATLVEAVLSDCDIRRGRFQNATLVGAAVLRSDVFEGVFEGADLGHADLRGSNFYGAEFWRARTEHARLDLAILERTKLA